MLSRTRNLPMWLFTIAIFLAPTLPRLVTEGTFLDGLLYAVLSRNMAEGIGTFWQPVVAPTLFSPFFCDHPPLAFGLQSLFFRACGDHLWVESLYSLATATATAAIMVGIWRRLTRTTETLRPLAWLPVLFWVSVPLVSWSTANNMLENTLTVFMLGAVILLIDSMRPDRNTLLFTFLAALCITGGLFTKGFLALFPLMVVPAWWLVVRGISARVMLTRTATLVVLVVAVTGAVLLFNGAMENVTAYFDKQLVSSLSGSRGSVPNRFGVVEKLVAELGPMLGIVLAIWASARWRRRADNAVPQKTTARIGWAMILIGACGSLPLIASPRQSGFYLVPSFPLYALGIAVLTAPMLDRLLSHINPRSVLLRGFGWTCAAVLAAIIVFSATRAGEVGRDHTLIAEVKQIGNQVGTHTTIGACPTMKTSYSLHGYLSRYFHIDLDVRSADYEYVLSTGKPCPSLGLEQRERVDTGTSTLQLYRRR